MQETDTRDGSGRGGREGKQSERRGQSVKLTDEPAQRRGGRKSPSAATQQPGRNSEGPAIGCNSAIKVLLYCKYFMASGLSERRPALHKRQRERK